MNDRSKRLFKEFTQAGVTKPQAQKAKDGLNGVWNKMLSEFITKKKSRGHRDLSFISDMIAALQMITGKV